MLNLALSRKSMEKAFLALFFVITGLSCSLSSPSYYNEVYDWPGSRIIPNDGRKFISNGSVLVQLPASANNTVTRDIRIREQVNITLDCGPLIDDTLDQEISTITNLSTTWYSVIRQYDGTFTRTNSIVEDNDEIVIFGNNMRFLQIHTPLIAVTAEQGNAGLYTCEFCYEFYQPLGGRGVTTCVQSDTDVNIRGDPPVIDHGFTPPDPNILIGTTICRPVDEVTVVCPQMGTTRPVGIANYLIDGMPIDLDNSLSFLRESRVTAAIDDRVSIFVSDFPATFEGVFTCNLTNPFGFDTESSLIVHRGIIKNLTSQPIGPCCFNITWDIIENTNCPPLNRYFITISKKNQVITERYIYNTQLTFCPVESGEYLVNVETNKQIYINISEKYNISGIKLLNQSLDSFQQWIINVAISIERLADKAPIMVYDVRQVIMRFLHTDELTIETYDISNATNDALMASFVTNDSLLNDKFYTFTLDIVLVDCGLIVRSTIEHPINFFEINYVEVLSDYAYDPLFRCHFVQGSSANGCQVKILQSGMVLETINITRDGINNKAGENFIKPGFYTIDVYDINNDYTVSSNAAFSKTINLIDLIDFNSPDTITTVDTAVFNCSTKHPDIAIEWIFNTQSANCTATSSDKDVTINGAGTNNSTFIIPGHLTQFNATIVSCRATGNINGLNFNKVYSANLQVQGKLDPVHNLMTQFDGSCCTNITWSPPYTLLSVPILKYNINISRDGQIVETSSTISTEETYCPVESGEYNISVIAVNKVGEGDKAAVRVSYPQKYNISRTALLDQYLNQTRWVLTIAILIDSLTDDDISLSMDDVQQIFMRFSHTGLTIETNNISNYDSTNNSLTASFVTNDSPLNDKFYTFTLDIVLVDCGLIVRSTIEHHISFFDVINITILYNIYPHATFTCYFVKGSIALGCHIEFSQNGQLVYADNITKDNDMTSAIKTFSDIVDGIYNITVYDINSDNTISSDAAYNVDIEIISNGTIQVLDHNLPGLEIGLSLGVSAFIAIAAIVILLIVVIIFRRYSKKVNSINLSSNNPYTETDKVISSENPYTYKLTMMFDKNQADNLQSSKLLVDNNCLRLLDCIGQGEYGLVYKAHLIDNEQMPNYVAVKTLKGNYDQNDISELLSESLRMKDLSHLNVMGLTGVCINAGPAPLVILPYMAGGSLLCYLKRNRDNILLIGDHTNQEKETELHLLSVCLQIARGMEYISSKSLVHRDLAARNCLIDHQGIIKVADFGLSSKLYDKVYIRQNMTEGIKLPIKWMAIESITDRIFSEKTDVWSFGVTCWEVFSGGKEPYGGIMPMAILKLLEQGQRMDKPNNNACSINTYENLMMACWSSSPDERPTFAQTVVTIENTLTAMGDYLDFNQFTLEMQEDTAVQECAESTFTN